VLCLAGFSALAQQAPVAALGGWSQATFGAAGQLPPGWGLLAAAVAACLLGAAVVFTGRATRDLVHADRARRRLGPGSDGLVITRDDRPTAYTLSVGPGAIVVSTGMLRLLTADERRALLAHEAAHLRHHHASYVLLTRLAAAANPLLRPLARSVQLAVELWADEAAAREVGDRRLVARALARASLAASARHTASTVALAIAETDVCIRVRALVGRPRRPHAWAVAAALVLTLVSSSAAVSLTWAMHQHIEIAQLAYTQAQLRSR
jgi:hypothetical protein